MNSPSEAAKELLETLRAHDMREDWALEAIDKFAAQARLEEAKWWCDYWELSDMNDAPEAQQRIVILQRQAGEQP